MYKSVPIAVLSFLLALSASCGMVTMPYEPDPDARPADGSVPDAIMDAASVDAEISDDAMDDASPRPDAVGCGSGNCFVALFPAPGTYESPLDLGAVHLSYHDCDGIGCDVTPIRVSDDGIRILPGDELVIDLDGSNQATYRWYHENTDGDATYEHSYLWLTCSDTFGRIVRAGRDGTEEIPVGTRRARLYTGSDVLIITSIEGC